MDLCVPKVIQFNNPRLVVVHTVLWLLMLVGLSLRFFLTQQYTKITKPTGHVNLWAAGYQRQSRETLEKLCQDALTWTLCQDPASFEYWYDDTGEWKYGPHVCAPVCSATASKTPDGKFCMQPIESFVQEDSNTVFFVTALVESLEGGPKAGDETYYFTPFTEGLELAFVYSFTATVRDVWGRQTQSAYYSTDKGANGVATKLVSSDDPDDVKREWKPGSDIKLQVKNILDLAGRSLDDPNPRSGPNKKPGSNGAGPIGRISGIDIVMALDCISAMDLLWRRDPECKLTVKSYQEPWVMARSVRTLASGELHSRRMFGIRVRLDLSGKFSMFDANNTLLNLTSLMVMLSIPAKIVLFIMTHLLGHLSFIYKQSLVGRFDLVDETAGMITRLVGMTAGFQEIVQKEAIFEGDGITIEMLTAKLSLLFNSKKVVLTDLELKNVAEMCFNAIKCLSKDAENKLNDEPRDSVPKSRVNLQDFGKGLFVGRIASEPAGNITFSEYAAAFSTAEEFEFHLLAKLFDSDRPRTFLERFFTPPNLQHFIYNSQGKPSDFIQNSQEKPSFFGRTSNVKDTE